MDGELPVPTRIQEDMGDGSAVRGLVLGERLDPTRSPRRFPRDKCVQWHQGSFRPSLQSWPQGLGVGPEDPLPLELLPGLKVLGPGPRSVHQGSRRVGVCALDRPPHPWGGVCPLEGQCPAQGQPSLACVDRLN